MLIQTQTGCVGSFPVSVYPILAAIAQLGGKRSDWYADSTSDIEETLAYHQVLREGDYLWAELASASQATEIKARLARYGLVCPPDSMTRGGAYLYSFRVRMWNAHTQRPMKADWVYHRPLWAQLFK